MISQEYIEVTFRSFPGVFVIKFFYIPTDIEDFDNGGPIGLLVLAFLWLVVLTPDTIDPGIN